MFQTFYESPIQHPILLLLVPLWFLTRLRPKAGAFSRSLAVFALLTLLDPLATGSLSSWLDLSGGAAQAVAIFFVILGDFRWFYFFELFLHQPFEAEQIEWRALLRAVSYSFIVPVLQALLVRLFPQTFDDSRLVFLAYELLFFAVALGFLIWKVPKVPPKVRGLKREICLYALLYYGLWATSDLIILAGVDVGYLLRVVPNQLYYSFFLPFVFWRSKVAGHVR